MKELFKIEFDFIGRKNEIIFYIYEDYKKIIEKFDIEISAEHKEASHCIVCDSPDGVIWLQSILFTVNYFNNPEHYIHELLHATKNILGFMDIKDEEMECYMLGFLAQKYMELLEELKIKN